MNVCRIRRVKILTNAVGCVIVLAIGLIPATGCSMTRSDATTGDRVGGPCEYRTYPGQAEIVSLAREEGAGT